MPAEWTKKSRDGQVSTGWNDEHAGGLSPQESGEWEVRKWETMKGHELSSNLAKNTRVWGQGRGLRWGLSLQPLVLPGTWARPVQGRLSSLTSEAESSWPSPFPIRALGGVRKVISNPG